MTSSHPSLEAPPDARFESPAVAATSCVGGPVPAVVGGLLAAGNAFQATALEDTSASRQG